MQRFTIEVELDDSGELTLAGALWDLSEELMYSDSRGWQKVKASNANATYQYRITVRKS